jgi:hypothetical protein
MTATATRWVRSGFHAAHLSTGPRRTACGTHLGYGTVTAAPDYARRCQRCVKAEEKLATQR